MPKQSPLVARRCFRCALAVLTALAVSACGGGRSSTAPPAAAGQAFTGVTDRVIVQPAQQALVTAYESRAADFAAAMSREAGVALRPVRQTHTGAHVLVLPNKVAAAELMPIVAALRRSADVAHAEPDVILQPTAVPNDPYYAQQWHLREPALVPTGINVAGAWDVTTGDPNLVIAVIDTGVLGHLDLSGRLLAGFDFISSTSIANDGNPRDVDATDAGDWLDATEAAALGRTPKPSSWHGTHVAGTIAAVGNNGFGVAGVNWNSRILPVRALGKGGGYISDIADGVVWSSGGTVTGIPGNPTPARVVNLSLGGSGVCSQVMQSAVTFANSRNVVVIAAAGNEGIDAVLSQPANCAGVITVGAVGSRGQLPTYSNFGGNVTLAAPGGDPQGDSGVVSLGDSGTRTPVFDHAMMSSFGTSMAAPHVAGAVSLMLSVNPALTPADVKALLQSTARAFPTGTGRDCSKALCGAGILNADAAVRAAASATPSPATPTPESGIWWNPAESGRGFVIETGNGQLSFGAYLYDDASRATWFNSAGPMQSPTSYSGALLAFRSGQTLGGGYQAPQGTLTVGQVTLQFTSATTAILQWPGGSVPIQKYRIAPPAVPSGAIAPQPGVWWNPQESGRGFTIEVQGGTLMFTGFMYDAAGNPTWHAAAAPLVGNTFSATLVEYGHGQTLTGPYRPNTIVNPNLGTVRLQFSDAATATLTLPNGSTVPLQKYQFASNGPAVTMAPNQLLTSRLIGIWSLDYKISTSFVDDFLFNQIRESPTRPGEYFVTGFNGHDVISVGGWDSTLNQYTVLAPGADYDDFYVFNLLTATRAAGCFHLAFRNPTRLGTCYTLGGERLVEIAPLQLLPLPAPRMPAATQSALRLQEHEQLQAQAAAPPLDVAKAPVLALRPEVARLIAAVEARRAALR